MLFGNQPTCCEEAQAATWRALPSIQGDATLTTSHMSEAILDHWDGRSGALVTNHGAVGGNHWEDITLINLQAGPGHLEAPHSLLSLEHAHCLPPPSSKLLKDAALRQYCGIGTSGQYTRLNPGKASVQALRLWQVGLVINSSCGRPRPASNRNSLPY